MKLIIGGAYQGKTELAVKKYSLAEDDIEVCTADALPSFNKKCLAHTERFAYYCVKNGLEPREEIEKREQQLENTVFIADDISCGVVPMDKTDRAWREAEGRLMSYIASRSDEVTRVFCGLEQRLKPGAEK